MNGNRQDAMVQAAESIIHYSFSDKELLWEALQAAGSNMSFCYPEGNKRLAMIGDAVLKLVVLEDLRATGLQRGKYYNQILLTFLCHLGYYVG